MRKDFDLSAIIKIVHANRCLLIRLDESAYYSFESRAGLGRPFTMAVPPRVIQDTRVPTLCFVFGDDLSTPEPDSIWAGGHVGVLARKRSLTAIEHGIKVIRSLPIDPATLEEVARLITDKRAARMLADRLASTGSVVSLPPELSAQLVRAVASRPSNREVFRLLSSDFRLSRGQSTRRLEQADAIKAALEIFGLHDDVQPARLRLSVPRRTELSRYWLREDSVIEHDSRSVPEFRMTESHVTGRALFRRDNEVLEVITANRRPLERVLGVDLIYHNLVRKSLVMVQYKMLDPAPARAQGSSPDWIYRPDSNLKKEIARMRSFAKRLPAAPSDYRLNRQMFYLKFVRRDKIGSSAAITLPLEHFEQLPLSKGSRGARRVSYQALNGAYLRNDAFFGLIRAGYIGSQPTATATLLPLINALVTGNRAVVIAIQSALPRTS